MKAGQRDREMYKGIAEIIGQSVTRNGNEKWLLINEKKNLTKRHRKTQKRRVSLYGPLLCRGGGG